MRSGLTQIKGRRLSVLESRPIRAFHHAHGFGRIHGRRVPMPEHPVPDAMAAADAAVRELAAPRACCVPHEVVSPNGTRADVYYWLRDDERKDPAVLAHLARENQYTEDILAPLAGLEQSLFEELTARLPPDDASVPV